MLKKNNNNNNLCIFLKIKKWFIFLDKPSAKTKSHQLSRCSSLILQMHHRNVSQLACLWCVLTNIKYGRKHFSNGCDVHTAGTRKKGQFTVTVMLDCDIYMSKKYMWTENRGSDIGYRLQVGKQRLD